MGKYTRYSSGYPTKWSNWTYPPKGVSTMQYLSAYFNGIIVRNQATHKAFWPFYAIAGLGLYGSYKISKASEGSEFNVSLRWDGNGSWLYGKPSPKQLHHWEEDKILRAPKL